MRVVEMPNVEMPNASRMTIKVLWRRTKTDVLE
jgi:hypothetical protein